MSLQGKLFETSLTKVSHPTQLGKSEIAYRQARSILTSGKGFMDAYDYTLNPYSGCTFGCTYCYAAFFSRSKAQRDGWGQWVTVKENAVALLRKKRPHALTGKTIYMSSVTDPYQPIEKQLELTRSLLQELVRRHQPRLVVQTRSPLVVRDLDLFQQFDHVQVNMTVTTDSDEVRRAFEPTCPNNRVRLQAIRQVADAGVDTCITLTPLLPVADPDVLAEQLLETNAKKFIVQPFHPTRGKFVAGTREMAQQAIERFEWTEARYHKVLKVLQARLPEVGIGKDGFAPPI